MLCVCWSETSVEKQNEGCLCIGKTTRLSLLALLPRGLSITKTQAFHVLHMDTLCCLMGWAGSLIGLSSHRLLSSGHLSGQLRHQKTASRLIVCIQLQSILDIPFSKHRYVLHTTSLRLCLHSACNSFTFPHNLPSLYPLLLASGSEPT